MVSVSEPKMVVWGRAP